MIGSLHHLIDLFLHLDVHLNALIQSCGAWSYAVLFAIIFCETGLVVTPILPGDSLLFAAGALAATGSLSPLALFVCLAAAAVLGDAANYTFGRYFGARAMARYPRIFRPEYLDRTKRFFERFGGKTVLFARFVPIVRTFAPFMAGVGEMSYGRFALYNVAGGLSWIALFIFGGFWFGNIPAVKHNFTLVILGIIILSVIPPLFETIRGARPQSKSVI